MNINLNYTFRIYLTLLVVQEFYFPFNKVAKGKPFEIFLRKLFQYSLGYIKFAIRLGSERKVFIGNLIQHPQHESLKSGQTMYMYT